MFEIRIYKRSLCADMDSEHKNGQSFPV